MPRVGDIVRAKYILIEFIGNGNFGHVYKSKNVPKKCSVSNEHSFCAIKFGTHDGISRALIKNEGMILNYLNRNNCLNVPLIVWYGLHEGLPALVMPFYTCTLSQYCKDNRITVSDADNIVQCISDTLRGVHDLHVIHRDLKPENFMLQGTWKLIDFGLASFDNRDTNATSKSGSIIGNIHYMSYNVHLGYRPTKVDDLISMTYIATFIHLSCTDEVIPWTLESSPHIIARMKYNAIYGLGNIHK